jgi:hypothetical protein
MRHAEVLDRINSAQPARAQLGGLFPDGGRPLAPKVYRLLKNYLRCRYGVKNRLRMLIYNCKLRFFACFCLVSAASPTFFNSLLAA